MERDQKWRIEFGWREMNAEGIPARHNETSHKRERR
jgi:hypothetical protein